MNSSSNIAKEREREKERGEVSPQPSHESHPATSTAIKSVAILDNGQAVYGRNVHSRVLHDIHKARGHDIHSIGRVDDPIFVG